VDPERIESHIEAGGYRALHDVLLEMSDKGVRETIIKSGLRGAGQSRIYLRASGVSAGD
jgi:NADH:ubiquinone oxidoreductase subunit F (NADH-binding)